MDITTDSGYEDYEWAIVLNRTCLRLLGVWPETDKTLLRKLMMDVRAITVLNIIFWSSAVPTIHSLVRAWGDITSMIDNLQYTLPIMVSLLKFFLMWRHKKDFIPLVRMVRQDWMRTKTTEERAVMIKRASTARLIMVWGYLVMVFSFALVMVPPFFGKSIRYLTNITDPGKVLPLQTYYVYNVSNSPFYEVTYVLQGISLGSFGAIYTGTDTFMGLLVFHVCAQLENLKARILGLDKRDFEEALSANVRDHIRLIRTIKTIDNSFTLMLLGLLIYFGMLFALYGFLFVTIMTQGRNLSVARLSFILTSFINTFTHMCLYCVVGEFLVFQCDGIYDAACQYEWYQLEPRQARNLMIIMMGANKPLYLTAGKLFPMTMSTFCNLLKTSGGYMSVLLAHRD